MKTLSLIGAGKMGQAMLKGWLSGGLPYPISIFDPNFNCDFEHLIRESGVLVNPNDPQKSDIVILGVKPQTFGKIIEDVSKFCHENTLCISIMAGINIERLQATGAKKIIRVMPNTPGQIGEGVCGLFGNSNCDKSDIEIATNLLRPLGAVINVGVESEIDAVTALSGSGPAYVFLMTELMSKAGQELGLTAKDAMMLAKLTVKGAGALMANSDEDPANLRAAVTSPGGTTKAALDVLMENSALETLISNAMKAAFNRAVELSCE